MKTKFVAILIITFSTAMFLPVVSASQHEVNQSNNDTVEIGVGQSLTVAIEATSSEVDQQVSEVALNRQLGQASDEGKRSDVLSKDLNETREEALDVREEYKKLTEMYKDGEITQDELVVKMSSLSNRADRIKSSIKNIEYATQFIPKQELNKNGVNQDTIDQVKGNLGVMGSDISKVTHNATLSPGSKIEVKPEESSIKASVKSSNGDVYEAEHEEKKRYDGFNITSVEAVGIIEDEFGINSSQYEVEVEEDDDYVGYYKIEAENEKTEYEFVVDGNTGDIVEYEKEKDTERDNKRSDKAEDRQKGQDGRGQAGEDGRSERGEKASETRGPPPWSEYDEVEEEDESEREEDESEREEDESEREEDESESNNTKAYNITQEEARLIALNNLSGDNWNVTDVEKEEDEFRFEFNRKNNATVEVAEVHVDTSSERVTEKEVEREQEERVDITREEAIDVVVKEFGIDRNSYKIHTEVEDGNYNVEAEANVTEAEYKEIEILVNGSSGRIIEKDVLDSGGKGNQDNEDQNNNQTKENGELSMDVDQRGNTTFIVFVTDDSGPIEGADILVNGEEVGRTNSDGKIAVDRPDSSEIKIVATEGDREAEIEIDNEKDDDTDEKDDDTDEKDEEKETRSEQPY